MVRRKVCIIKPVGPWLVGQIGPHIVCYTIAVDIMMQMLIIAQILMIVLMMLLMLLMLKLCWTLCVMLPTPHLAPFFKN